MFSFIIFVLLFVATVFAIATLQPVTATWVALILLGSILTLIGVFFSAVAFLVFPFSYTEWFRQRLEWTSRLRDWFVGLEEGNKRAFELFIQFIGVFLAFAALLVNNWLFWARTQPPIELQREGNRLAVKTQQVILLGQAREDQEFYSDILDLAIRQSLKAEQVYSRLLREEIPTRTLPLGAACREELDTAGKYRNLTPFCKLEGLKLDEELRSNIERAKARLFGREESGE